MKFAVGIFTCERFEFLQTTINSLYEHNPGIKKYPLIISDDASSKEDVIRMMREWPFAHILHCPERRGFAENINKLHDYAERTLRCEYLFVSVNDYECLRRIDFDSLLKLMDTRKDIGQLQFVHFKGQIYRNADGIVIGGDKKRARADFNWTTRKPIKVRETVKVGAEKIRGGNWSYCFTPQITRLGVTWICDGAMGVHAFGDDKAVQAVELKMVHNWHMNRLENYEVNNQAFLHLDWDFGKRTRNLKS